jgi:hypothetical protein
MDQFFLDKLKEETDILCNIYDILLPLSDSGLYIGCHLYSGEIPIIFINDVSDWKPMVSKDLKDPTLVDRDDLYILVSLGSSKLFRQYSNFLKKYRDPDESDYDFYESTLNSWYPNLKFCEFIVRDKPIKGILQSIYFSRGEIV